MLGRRPMKPLVFVMAVVVRHFTAQDLALTAKVYVAVSTTAFPLLCLLCMLYYL